MADIINKPNNAVKPADCLEDLKLPKASDWRRSEPVVEEVPSVMDDYDDYEVPEEMVVEEVPSVEGAGWCPHGETEPSPGVRWCPPSKEEQAAGPRGLEVEVEKRRPNSTDAIPGKWYPPTKEKREAGAKDGEVERPRNWIPPTRK